MALSLLLLLTACRSSRKLTNDSMNEPIVGGYTEHRQLTQDDLRFFNEVCRQYGGIDATPVSVSTQVVAGTNYCFRCKDDKGKMFDITILRPLPGRGNPMITEIQEVGKSKKASKVIIVYYDAEVGTGPLDAVIVAERCEVLYRYANINAYSIKMKKESTRTVLENTKGVLSVVDDQVMQLQPVWGPAE